MRIFKLIDRILLSANEDYIGLWEVPWEVVEVFGEQSHDDVMNCAREVISELVTKGWIKLYWCHEPLDNVQITLISFDDVTNVLLDEDNWDVSSEKNLSVRFLSTEKGEKAFERRFLRKSAE